MVTSAVLMAVLAGAGSVSIRADPGFLVGGSGLTATLQIAALDAKGQPLASPLVLTTDVGTIDGVQQVKPGQWKATLRAPAEKFPQYAFLLAEVGDAPPGWLALPVHGSTSLKVETSKPFAKVQVTISGRTFGPVPTDDKGQAELPVVVPPGIQEGSALSEDKLGNKKKVSVDLKPPPLRRLRVAALGTPDKARPTAGPDDAAPHRLAIFAVEKDGSAARRAQLTLRADKGEVLAPRSAGFGTWESAYLAPKQIGDGADVVSGQLAGSPARADLAMTLVPGEPARVELTVEPPHFVAGSGQKPRLVAKVFDRHGNLCPAARAQFEVDFGILDAEGAWTVPDGFAGRSAAAARARVGPATGNSELRLKAGAPASGEIALDHRLVEAGGPTVRGTVRVRDAFANPVPGLVFESAASLGRVAAFRETAAGQYAFEYTTARSEPPGETSIQLRCAGAPAASTVATSASREPLVLSAPIGVLPPRVSWSTSLGLIGTTGHNFRKAWGSGGRAELSVVAGESPVELALDFGARTFSPTSTNEYLPMKATGTATELSTGATVRWVVPFTARVELAFGAGGGARYVWTKVNTDATPEVSGDDAETEQNDQGWAGLVRGVAAARLRLGPGRAVAELQYAWAPMRNGWIVNGDSGGLGLGLGYMVRLR